MAHFAQIDENNIVTRVLVIEQDEIDTGDWGDPASFVQTSYNTHGGVYYTPNSFPPTPDPDQSKAFRKNYAGIGYIYHPDIDGFSPPKVYPSWILDPTTGLWEAPVPKPPDEDGFVWIWDEDAQEWVQEPVVTETV